MVTTTCREVQNLLELFFDSELEPRQMRSVALHSATCAHCEQELRHLEHLQDLVATTISDRIDECDLARMWAGIEARLEPRRASWLRQLREWWAEREIGWGVPAFGTAVAVAVAALLLLQPGAREPVQIAENPVSIHEISSESHVALLSEADTLLLWVDHELSGSEAAGMGDPVSFEAFE